MACAVSSVTEPLLTPFLHREQKGSPGTGELISTYAIADFAMVVKFLQTTTGFGPQVNSPLKSTQNFGLQRDVYYFVHS